MMLVVFICNFILSNGEPTTEMFCADVNIKKKLHYCLYLHTLQLTLSCNFYTLSSTNLE